MIAPPPWINGQFPVADIRLGLPPRSANYGCLGGQMTSATAWLGIIGGGALMALCIARKVNASILIGILFVTFIAWIPNQSNKATYFKDWSSIPGGEARFEYFLKVGGVTPHLFTHPQLDTCPLPPPPPPASGLHTSSSSALHNAPAPCQSDSPFALFLFLRVPLCLRSLLGHPSAASSTSTRSSTATPGPHSSPSSTSTSSMPPPPCMPWPALWERRCEGRAVGEVKRPKVCSARLVEQVEEGEYAAITHRASPFVSDAIHNCTPLTFPW